jgi:hypothetical protein
MSPKKKSPVKAVPVAKEPAPQAGSVGTALVASVRGAATFTTGDQVAPAAVLWPDPERLWEGVLPVLKALFPELHILGAYAPAERTGPAVWLRCVEARRTDPRVPVGSTPVFYLPGVSRQQLREVEDCPAPLQPLVELQFRGAVWAHPNGRDWTPFAFLGSEHGGLGLDLAQAAESQEALLRALPRVLQEQVDDLRGQRLDQAFFNGLLAPDLHRAVLNWMNDPDGVRAGLGPAEWKAFCQQCAVGLKFRPEKDGELHAAELLGTRNGGWGKAWTWFAATPARFPRVVELLQKVDVPKQGILVFDQEPWPQKTAEAEELVAHALTQLRGRHRAEAVPVIRALEKAHGHRRAWVWKELGRCQLALALGHLDRLVGLTEKPLAAPSAAELAALYAATGWEADRAALAALACCTSGAHQEPVFAALRALYLPWLDESARNLQQLCAGQPEAIRPRLGPVQAAESRVILFADGLRYDLAQILAQQLQAGGMSAGMAWDWAPFPAVTATGKPWVSPVAHLLKGGEADEDFNVSIAANGHSVTKDRLAALLTTTGVQVIDNSAAGDCGGKAWTEAGSIDEHGHHEGWKLSRLVALEISDLGERIRHFLEAGWAEVLVVTDHGWLLMPEGLSKISLPKCLVVNRWGRCAAMQQTAATDLPLIPWHWNPAVTVASPPGVGCFTAGQEYVHGGISAQELVVPRLTVRAGAAAQSKARVAAVKWVGLRCRVTVQDALPGLRADLRTQAAAPESSKVEGQMPREVSADGTVSLPAGDDHDEGLAVVVVLLAPDGEQVLHSLPTQIGGNP